MRLGLLSVGLGALGLGAAMQSGGSLPYDLGEVAQPLEEFAGGAADAGGAVLDAVGKGAELPAWLLACALVVVLVRSVMFSPTADKAVQGRNDRLNHDRAMALRRLDHEQEMERINAGHETRAQDRAQREQDRHDQERQDQDHKS